MIVLGIKSCLVHSLSLKDLGVQELPENQKDVTIEGRKRYFHLMYIPFFPIGDYWVLVKDEKEYHVPSEIMLRIHEKNLEIKAPWYCFLGPIAALFFGLLFLTSTFVNQNSNTVNENDHKTENLIDADSVRWAALKSMLEKPDTANYYLFTSSDSRRIVGQFVSLENGRITLSLFKAGISKGNTEELIHSVNKLNMLDTFVIDQSQIDKLRENNGAGSFSFSEYPDSYMLEGVYRLYQPWFLERRCIEDEVTDNYCIALVNFGAKTKITKLETISGNVNWNSNNLQKTDLNSGEQLELKGNYNESESLGYLLRLTCTDEKNKVYRFRIECINGNVFISEEQK